MVEIKKENNSHGYHVFKIQTDEGIFEISFQNNLDLYWRYINENSILDEPKQKEFYITKENCYLYYLIEELYTNIKEFKPFGDKNEELNAHYQYLNKNNPRGLFKENRIDWHSDDFEYECASRLLIEKKSECYKITFVKNNKQYNQGTFMTFSVRISNSGSRYNPFNNVFMDMYNKLKEYNPNYYQVYIEEEIYKHTLSKKLK